VLGQSYLNYVKSSKFTNQNILALQNSFEIVVA